TGSGPSGPAPSTPGRSGAGGADRRRSRAPRRISAVVAALVGGVVALVALESGVLSFLRDGEESPNPVRQDLRLALVEQSKPGACTDELPPPTFHSAELGGCYRISTRSEDRMSVRQLRQVRAEQDKSGAWVITMTFDEGDGKRFAALTGRAAPRAVPRNQIAIVLGDRLISAPAINSAITGGEAQIAGTYTEAEAKALARELGARS
ncbi:hypothetical protein AB0N23_19860, partial [Streptomyces sp. NPDC052644]